MRYLPLKIFIVFLVLAMALCGWKWNTWFGNPIEVNYTTPSTPNRIMLSLGEDADYDRAVSWRCDSIITKAWVSILEKSTNIKQTIEAKGTIVKTPGGSSAFYRAELKNLREGDYRYQVGNSGGLSDWREFTVQKKDDSLSFLYLGDIQDKVNGLSDTIFSHINKKYPNLDFWMFAGDAVERPLDKYWEEFYSSGDSIFDRKPIIACTGNHEYYKAVFKRLDNRWTHYWPLPKNGPRLFKGRACSWEMENASIISLDTDGIQGMGTYFAQFYWARRILKTTNKKWKIVFMHHPVQSAGEGRSTIIMRILFKMMFDKYGVDLVLQGHDHSYSRYTAKEDGVKKTPAYVVSTCSRKCYDIEIDENADRLGSCVKLYQLLNITKNKLSYKSYTIDDEYYDGFSIMNIDSKKVFLDEKPVTAEKLETTARFKRKKSKSEKEARREEIDKRNYGK